MRETKKLPDKLHVLGLTMSKTHEEGNYVAREYNSLPEDDPKRGELYKRYKELESEDRWD
ncbi:MAG: hypothetical protein ISS95_00310 [Candidatus Aenigmarchaeota archaeon]|nr:hypothetical protein [Candidatus Aenigmarchaeota archaeon]